MNVFQLLTHLSILQQHTLIYVVTLTFSLFVELARNLLVFQKCRQDLARSPGAHCCHADAFLLCAGNIHRPNAYVTELQLLSCFSVSL